MNLALMRLIDKQFLETPFYGVRQMCAHLQNEGHAVNEKRIRRPMRLMRLMRLMPICQKPNTSKPAKGHKTCPCLLGGLRIDRPNQVWRRDITHSSPRASPKTQQYLSLRFGAQRLAATHCTPGRHRPPQHGGDRRAGLRRRLSIANDSHLRLIAASRQGTSPMSGVSPVLLGFLGSLAAGSLTAVGAIPVLFGRLPSRPMRDLSLGFAAGVMLAASFFSLIIPALAAAGARYDGGTVPAGIVCIAVLLGMGMVAMLNEHLPHEHFRTGREGPEAVSLRRVWLFIIAITIHNVPEGLAVGVGFGAGGVEGGLPLAIGIGLQNAPEGLAVAVALLGEGYSRRRAFGIAALTGAVEPVGGFVGAAVVTFSEPLLPWGLAFAAGAMLYVISHEIIPETHRSGHQNKATLGLALGLVIMMFLDISLG